MLKNLVYLSIFTMFVVLVWVGLSLYHNFTATTISDVAQVQIIPIPNTFNPEVIETLKKRNQITTDLSETIAQTSTSSAKEATGILESPIVFPLEPDISTESVEGVEL